MDHLSPAGWLSKDWTKSNGYLEGRKSILSKRSAVAPEVWSLYLLTDLFGLHSGGVLSAEAELGDGHVVQDDVEVFGPLKQLSADQQGNLEGTECQLKTGPVSDLFSDSQKSFSHKGHYTYYYLAPCFKCL